MNTIETHRSNITADLYQVEDGLMPTSEFSTMHDGKIPTIISTILGPYKNAYEINGAANNSNRALWARTRKPAFAIPLRLRVLDPINAAYRAMQQGHETSAKLMNDHNLSTVMPILTKDSNLGPPTWDIFWIAPSDLTETTRHLVEQVRDLQNERMIRGEKAKKEFNLADTRSGIEPSPKLPDSGERQIMILRVVALKEGLRTLKESMSLAGISSWLEPALPLHS